MSDDVIVPIVEHVEIHPLPGDDGMALLGLFLLNGQFICFAVPACELANMGSYVTQCADQIAAHLN